MCLAEDWAKHARCTPGGHTTVHVQPRTAMTHHKRPPPLVPTALCHSQRGYKLNDRVIRPAEVGVVKNLPA